MRAAIYTRVSTEDQAREGYSIGEQERRCRDWIDREGWTYVDTFVEAGKSGTLKHRPQLDRLLGRLDDVDVVVINSLDRLGRSTKNLLDLYGRFEAAGVGLVFLRERLDTTTPVGRLLRTVLSAIAEFERDLIAERTSSSMAARVRQGRHSGGQAPYGYAWEGKRLIVVEHEADVVRRIFADYLGGRGQRAIVRALNDAGVPARPRQGQAEERGGQWYQSAVNRILSSVTYVGKLEFKGEVVEAEHEPIIDESTWTRTQAIRAGSLKRKGGRQPASAHLLTRGLLRCPKCGSAMIPRKARKGVERERYVCRGRIERGPEFCSQPSIRRELIDEPFLAHLLNGYIDLEATRARIEERMTTALLDARQVLQDADGELQRGDARLARVRRGWQDGVIDDAEYSAQTDELRAERDAAQAALQRAQDHVQALEAGRLEADGEKVLLDHLAALKAAAGAHAGAAPDIDALRNVIGQIFDRVQIVRGWFGMPADLHTSPGLIVPGNEGDAEAQFTADGQSYWLLPVLKPSAVDMATFSPIGHEIPVPWSGQYPNGFLCRYCWW